MPKRDRARSLRRRPEPLVRILNDKWDEIYLVWARDVCGVRLRKFKDALTAMKPKDLSKERIEALAHEAGLGDSGSPVLVTISWGEVSDEIIPFLEKLEQPQRDVLAVIGDSVIEVDVA